MASGGDAVTLFPIQNQGRRQVRGSWGRVWLLVVVGIIVRTTNTVFARISVFRVVLVERVDELVKLGQDDWIAQSTNHRQLTVTRPETFELGLHPDN